jgi:trehalose 6-phosphate synthase
VWIGWPGTSEEVELDRLLTAASKSVGYELEPVPLTEAQVDGYYRGFANEIVWPLFHDMQTRCNFDPAYWEAYEEVNRRFAQVIAEHAAAGDYIWVHDYHLMRVATYLRDLGVEQRLGFFLHTPFPPVDIFIKLPWRQQILQGLMAYDLLGFQTIQDRNNFLGCAVSLLKIRRPDTRRRVATIALTHREIRVGSFGISIDFDEFDRQARVPAVVERVRELRQEMPDGKLILGIDRLDYSKGIPERLKAFERALERYPELHGTVTCVQVAIPSRVDIPEYQHLRAEIEGLVSRINGRFTQFGWVPIHYLFRSLDRNELLAFYRAADIALITPLKDGMNLIAKEYCAANVDNNGVLILSEFAGAARSLGRHALLVNPYDIDGVADAIRHACNLSWTERQSHMRRLRQIIRTRNIFWWLETFLNASYGWDLDDASDLPGNQTQGDVPPVIREPDYGPLVNRL